MDFFPIKVAVSGWAGVLLALVLNLAWLYAVARIIATGVRHGLGL